MITVKEIKNMLENIQLAAERYDYWMAHEIESHLKDLVLEAIADGHEDPKLLSEYALRANTINYPRSY